MEEIGIPELTVEQIVELCERAEKAARNYILSKVSTGKVVTLDVMVDADGTKPVTANVDVRVILSPLMKDFDVEVLTKEATIKAFDNIEEYLRELECKPKK